MYRDNKNGKLGIIITIIVLIILVIFSNTDNEIWSNISNPFTKVVMSIQEGVTYLKNKISKNEDYFISVDNLKKQNQQLIDQNEDYKKKNQELELLKAENKTLKNYMKLVDKYYDYNCIPAYVIQRDFSNYSKIVVISEGKEAGIEKGMTVVADGGLVGYVISVEDKTSKVQIITDTASAVSCVISGTEKSLVTRGILDSNNKIKGTYIDNDVVINEGDNIETSGIGGIYPKNINVGKVKEIVNTQNKTNRYIYVETSVDFEKLSDILVIKR